MARKGETWNESLIYRDAWTLRQVRQVTTHGVYNETPNYHTNIGFTADGEFLIFGSARADDSAIFRCHVASGDMTQLIDPVGGVGAYSEWHKGGACPGNGLGVNGQMCIAPRSRWAVFLAGRSLRAVHIETLQERTLIPDIGAEWVAGMPSIDPLEQHVIVPVMSAHPDLVAGRRPSKPYRDYFASGAGMVFRLLQVPLSGGIVIIVREEKGVGGAHTPHSPADPDLILLDRDFPPNYWAGSDGKTNRIWILRLSTGALTELPPVDEARFQVHCVWTWDGQHIIYHGRSAKGGYYIGVTDKEGHTLREYGFHNANHYGHVSAMAGRPAIILDGNLSNDLLLWLYYDAEKPRVEVIARHGTAWGALPGQYTHPHPLSDPTGRYISFNVGHGGRSDVFIVSV
jgi:hypothetical protein